MAKEFKHIKCPTNATQDVIDKHQLFFWELQGTDTVVSKESHIEEGGSFDDSLYSVTTEERFTTIDFVREKDIPNYSKIRSVESEYYSLVKQFNDIGATYDSKPEKDINWILFLILLMIAIAPGVIYYYIKYKKHKERVEEWESLREKVDDLFRKHNEILNT